jgi:hypothetical protein
VVRASEAKTPLMQDAFVQGKSIYLSDLLPESSPTAISIPAHDIVIGRSPQPGSTRVLSSAEIVRSLDGEKILNEVAVPQQIVVHRAGHLITREEVADAVRRTLNRNEALRTIQITAESIRSSAHVFTSMPNADLRVTRIELDRSLREIKFWLVSGAEPTLLPFMATVSATCDACEQAEAPPGGAEQSSNSQNKLLDTLQTMKFPDSSLSEPTSTQPAVVAPALVEAGKMARLHLSSGSGMQMYLAATALERGTLGQIIRVKIQDTGKILPANVVGRGQLEAQF